MATPNHEIKNQLSQDVSLETDIKRLNKLLQITEEHIHQLTEKGFNEVRRIINRIEKENNDYFREEVATTSLKIQRLLKLVDPNEKSRWETKLKELRAQQPPSREASPVKVPSPATSNWNIPGLNYLFNYSKTSPDSSPNTSPNLSNNNHVAAIDNSTDAIEQEFCLIQPNSSLTNANPEKPVTMGEDQSKKILEELANLEQQPSEKPATVGEDQSKKILEELANLEQEQMKTELEAKAKEQQPPEKSTTVGEDQSRKILEELANLEQQQVKTELEAKAKEQQQLEAARIKAELEAKEKEQQQLEAERLKLEALKIPEKPKTPEEIKQINKEFVAAFTTRNFEKIKTLMNENPNDLDINQLSPSKQTALHFASQLSTPNSKQWVEFLLNQGATTQPRDGNNQTAVHYAIESKNKEVLEVYYSRNLITIEHVVFAKCRGMNLQRKEAESLSPEEQQVQLFAYLRTLNKAPEIESAFAQYKQVYKCTPEQMKIVAKYWGYG